MDSLDDLQRHIVDDVLSENVSPHDDGWFNGLEVRALLRQYPTTEMAFVFPRPVSVPQTRFQVQTRTSVAELQRADHAIFYIELSDVHMVRLATDLGLVVQYGAGPTGTTAKGVAWLWGVWGQFCAIPNADGSWHAYPLGGVLVSELTGADAPREATPPNKPLNLSVPPQKNRSIIESPVTCGGPAG